jgi:hypothetical protein
MLTEGVKVSYQKDGSQRGDLIWLVDFTSFPSSSLGMHILEVHLSVTLQREIPLK